MKTKTRKKKSPKLAEMIAAAKEAGVEVRFEMQPKKLPRRCEGDHEHVTLLLEEAERMNTHANNWLRAEKPNPVAAQKSFEIGWAHALSAAWLRCRLKGEIGPARKELTNE